MCSNVTAGAVQALRSILSLGSSQRKAQALAVDVLASLPHDAQSNTALATTGTALYKRSYTTHNLVVVFT